MSAHGERALILHLSEAESLDILAREGLPEYVVPTEELRLIYVWAMGRYFRGGRTKAPSIAAILAEWEDILKDHDIDMNEEPEDSIELAIDDLIGSYIHLKGSEFNRDMANDLSGAQTQEKIDVLNSYASLLIQMGMDLGSHEFRVDAREAMPERIQAYEARVTDHDLIHGMRIGFPQIDNYTRGIHPGELAVLAAGPKVGKSFMMAWVALNEWRAGKVTTFFTLENSVDMTLDRLACFATGVRPREWQAGTCSSEDIEKMEQWVEDLRNHDTPLHIIQPGLGKRSVEALVQQAQLNDSDSLLIDQLSFLEVEDERAPRYLQIRELTHKLKSMISASRDRMPCLLAHQINRDGMRSSSKVGYLEMEHLAEGSEVERTADWVFGIHRSKSESGYGTAKFQTLASRREYPRHFEMSWNIADSQLAVKSEITDLENS